MPAGERDAPSTTDATAGFFEQLAARGHEALLNKTRGTLRFDITGGERTDSWFVEIDRGDISVARKDAAADCVVRADGAVFNRLASGEANATAALLRGTVFVEGDLELVLLFQRLLPSPPRR